MYNRLLQRQLQKYFKDSPVPENITDLLKTISSSYDHHEQDRMMLERSIEISSQEMIELYELQKKTFKDLQVLFENIKEVVFTLDVKENKYLLISPACELIYGYPIADFYENPNLWQELILDEDQKMFKDHLKQAQSGEGFTLEYQIRNKDGNLRWLETRVTPGLENGVVVRIDGVTADITKRKLAEEKIARSEAQLRSLFDYARDPIFLLDENQCYIGCNEAAVKILGVSGKDEILNHQLKDFSPQYQPDGRLSAEKSAEMDAAAFARGSVQFEWQQKHANGSLFPVEVSLSSVPMGSSKILLMHWRDITERKHAEHKLNNINHMLTMKARKNLAYQKTLLELSSSQKSNLEERFEEIVKATALAMDVARVSIWLYNEDHTAIVCRCLYVKRENRFEKGLELYERNFPKYFAAMAKNRSISAIDAHTHVATSEFSEVYLTPLGIQSMLDVPIRLNGKIIGVVCHEETDEVKFWSEEEQLFASSIADMITIEIESSVRREAEEKLAAQNKELQKTNTELDRFVYSVSHDLRAPLSSMLGIIEISEDETENPLIRKHLEMLKNSVKKLDGFIEDILTYSRNSRLEVKQVEINFHDLIHELTHHLQFIGAQNRKVDIQVDIAPSTRLTTDKSRLNIILSNLISNAIRYQNPDHPHPHVRIQTHSTSQDTTIIISDNGIGIAPEYHDKIFSMFFRVSERSVGSGLGLYIVKEALEKLNGSIELQSEHGKGCTFIIKLPIN